MPTSIDTIVEGRFIRDIEGLKAALVAGGFLVNWCASNENPPFVIVSLDQTESKDPSAIVNAFQDAGQLHAASNKAAGFDGVAECPGDGVATHTVSIVLKDFSGAPLALDASLQVIASQIVPLSASKPPMVAGAASVVVGPVSGSGEIQLCIADQANKHYQSRIKVRFV